MGNRIDWTYGDLTGVHEVILSAAADPFLGPWDEVARLDPSVVTYIDYDRPRSTYYRLEFVMAHVVDPYPFTVAGAVVTLPHSDILSDTFSLRKSGETVDYEEGVDYTLNDPTPGDVTLVLSPTLAIGDELRAYYTYIITTKPTIPKKDETTPRCIIYGYVLDVSGSPVEDELLYFKTHNPPQVRDTYVFTALPKEVRTGSDGYFEVPLYQKTTVSVTSIRAGIDVEIVIPEEDTKDFSILLEEAL